MLQVGYLVKDFLLPVLEVPLELSLIGIYKGLGVTQALAKECREFIPCDRDRSFAVISPLVVLPAKADPVPQKERGKENPGRSRSSSNSKIVFTLLTKVVAVYVGLFALYLRKTGLQLLPECFSNDGGSI